MIGIIGIIIVIVYVCVCLCVCVCVCAHVTGMSISQLERLGEPRWKEDTIKISRRDLSFALSQVK